MTGVQLALDIPTLPPRDRHRPRRGVVPADQPGARHMRTRRRGLRPIHTVTILGDLL